MILSLLITAFLLAGAQEVFVFPQVENYQEYPNSLCVVDPTENKQPTYARTLFLNEGVEACAAYCTATPTCSGFSFSNYLKDVCQLYLLDLDDDGLDTLNNLNLVFNGTTLTARFTWITFSGGPLEENVHATTGAECVDAQTSPFCLPSHKFYCYIHLTSRPSTSPSYAPSLDPTVCPSNGPTVQPSNPPSVVPTKAPSLAPSKDPTVAPSQKPSVAPSKNPTVRPSNLPSTQPSKCPTVRPSKNPTVYPSFGPSTAPSRNPTVAPSLQPSTAPSKNPSLGPSVIPSDAPSTGPSKAPTVNPSFAPSTSPSFAPSVKPSDLPSCAPSVQPSVCPSQGPSLSPTYHPSVQPSQNPIGSPSKFPSTVPSRSPVPQPSVSPSVAPTFAPSHIPSVTPSDGPTAIPSLSPSTNPSKNPSFAPSVVPSKGPTVTPSKSPSTNPSTNPSISPSFKPSTNPSVDPSTGPSVPPTNHPSTRPSTSPSVDPSRDPTLGPSFIPSTTPSQGPSVVPSKSPSVSPSTAPSNVPTVQPSVTNPCSIGNDDILGSTWVDLLQSESSFTDDVLTITLQVPRKYRILNIRFNGGILLSQYNGEDTDYWTMTTKEGEECLYRPQFSATWVQIKTLDLIDFDILTEVDYQYLFDRVQLDLEETVVTDLHQLEYNRTVEYEMPYAIRLEKEIALEVDFQMIIPTSPPSVSPSVNPSVSPSFSPSTDPTKNPSFSPSTDPSTSPSFNPSVSPTVAPSTKPSGAPTPMTMDHLFTRYALLAPNAEGSSRVDINFTTIVRRPWYVQDGEFEITDGDDLIKDDTEVFTLIQDCYTAFNYQGSDGFCVDEDGNIPNVIYADLDGTDPDLCKIICDQSEECEAYDVSTAFDHCEIIGATIDKTWVDRYTSYLPTGEEWTFRDGSDKSPTGGQDFFGTGTNACFVKQEQAWQTSACDVAPQDAPEPEACFCTQEWNLQYDSPDVCDVSGWWTVQMELRSLQLPARQLYYSTDVWVGLTSACAKVVGSNDVCMTDAPCTIVGLDDVGASSSRFYVNENATFKITVGSNAPMQDLDIISITSQQNSGSVDDVDMSLYTKGTVSNSPLTDNRFSSELDFVLLLNEPGFTGTVEGVVTTLEVVAEITYQGNVRRRLTLHIADGETPQVQIGLSIMVYPKQCLEPQGYLNSFLITTCPSGKTIQVCKADGWETIQDHCAAEAITEVQIKDEEDEEIQVIIQNNDLENSERTNDDTLIIIDQSDNESKKMWRTATIVIVAVVLLVAAIYWFYSAQKTEKDANKQIEWKLENDDNVSEWDVSTDYSTDTGSEANFYDKQHFDKLAMKKAYEEIFHAAYVSGIESDV